MEAKPLTTTQRREALGYLMFLKQKRSGKIKARGCADGRPQRAYIPQEDARAPTVSTEAVFMTAVIDAMENRTVAVVDIPEAFMQADMTQVYICVLRVPWLNYFWKLIMTCTTHTWSWRKENP